LKDRPAPLDLLGLPVHPVTMQQALNLVESELTGRGGSSGLRPVRHVALNAAKVVDAGDDPRLARVIRRADLVTADGVGVIALARRLGQRLPERVTGIDLMEGLCARAALRGWPIYMLGGRPGVAEGAAASLVRRYPALRVVGTSHGYFRESEVPAVADRIAISGAQLLFVAMNTPRKEHFGDRWGERAGVDFVMGVGGAFDVLCGQRRRAPIWVQGLGLEWVWRWGQEPRRLAHRYGLGGLRFSRRLLLADRPVPPDEQTTATHAASRSDDRVG
jgi:N-acetylglucosaminyldiphosphoundecaprenol N-acetyl-beta-D-mannosaminyltransferase